MTEKKRCESNRRKRILFHNKIGENRQQRAANPPKNDTFLKRKELRRKTRVRGAQDEDTGAKSRKKHRKKFSFLNKKQGAVEKTHGLFYRHPA